MNLSAIYSKTGKGVQEASGKTSNLSRADRAVLAAFDGKTSLTEVQKKFEKLAGPKFEALVQQLDKDGFIREVSSGATQPAAPAARAAPPKAPPPAAKAPADSGDEGLDFTQAIKLPPKPAAPAAPKGPPMDLAAAARAETERKEKEQPSFDYKARQEAEAKAKVEADARARATADARAKADADAKARAEAEAKARAEAEAKARADADAKSHAEADAKVKAAREAAMRMATEAKAKSDAAAEREREALGRARKESEDKARLEAELTGKLEEERKARAEAERRAQDAADVARKELEEKSRRDAEELRQRLEAEMKAKLEEERKAREAEDRKRREEEDRRRKEEDERRRKEDEERNAKLEAERKAREEEDRRRKQEEEHRRKEEEERRAKEDAERKARAEEDRKRREEEDRRRKEEDERRRKEEEERRAKEAAERKAREEDERKRREEETRARAEEDRKRREEGERKQLAEDERRAKEDAERRAREEADAKARAAQSASTPSLPTISPPPPPPPPAAPPASLGGLDDSLLADLDNFGKKEEEEQKAKEEAERKAKEEAARRAKEESERQAREAAEKKRREEDDRRRKEEDERRAREEAERQEKEEEARRKEEEAERKRKAKEALAAKQAEQREAERAAKRASGGTASAKSGAKADADDDIVFSDSDLDMDDVKRDERALSKEARMAREQASAPPAPVRRPKKWGKPVAIGLFVVLVGGVGLLHVMPVSTTDYEKAASEAMGVPVKIGSARLSLITGVEVKFDSVSIGDSVKIRNVRGFPEIGSLFGAKKSFNRVELEGVSFSQSQLADAVLGKVSGDNLRIGKVIIKQAKLEGPLTLPALDVEATVSGDGSLQSISLRGGDKLVVQLSPRGNDIGFEISAGSLALPFVPALTLSEFGMKGTANRGGVTSSEFDGRSFDGLISGTAKIRWGAGWTVDGEVRARGVKVAVFAPALVSEGKVEGRAAYGMSGSNPATLYESARVQGEFKIEQGVLGSFDLTRALQTGGTQSQGRTVFSELTGQAVYDKGAMQIRNVSITAGAMNAGASIDIDPNGGLSGRIAAEVKAATQTLRATLNLSGKVQDPVIRK